MFNNKIKLDDIILELQNVTLPPSIRLDQATNIIDVKKFVESHVNTLKGNKGNKRYMPYFNRLKKVYEILKNNN